MEPNDKKEVKKTNKKTILVANGPFNLKEKNGHITRLVSGDRIMNPIKYQLDQADGNILRKVEVENV